MRKLLLLAAASMSLGLSECTGVNTPINPGDVQKYAQAFCSFLPTIQTITNIINLGGPIVGGAEAIAKAICDNLPKPPANATAARALRTTHPTMQWNFRSVPISGCYKKPNVCI